MSFMDRAREMVTEYTNKNTDPSDGWALEFDDTFVTWFSKTLQNWKCLISTNNPDGMYYEVTHDGDEKRTFLAAYKLWETIEIPDPPPGSEEPRMLQTAER